MGVVLKVGVVALGLVPIIYLRKLRPMLQEELSGGWKFSLLPETHDYANQGRIMGCICMGQG